MSAPVILWFRDDLRLADHAALHAAAETGQPVLPLYILDDAAAGPWAMGGASRWWLHHSLAAHAAALSGLGAELVLRRGDSQQILLDLIERTGASDVFTGGMADPWARALDRSVAAAGVRLHRMRTGTLFAPDAIKTKAGGAYGVYTPFANACLATGGHRDPIPAPKGLRGFSGVESEALADWGLLPSRPDWAGGLRATWTPGEASAMRRAKAFLAKGLSGYPAGRDRPDGDHTSMLSPHLHFGEISPVQLWHMAPEGKGRDVFIREVLWREFCINLLWHHPTLPDEPLREEFAAFPRRTDHKALRAWQRGRTGVPIVDAGMRQLWRTGWMHNRVRMIVASFLVKHLLIPWQEGQAWFWDTLVDADLPNNAGNWQWVAGCGADAAPFFRIFNPVLQGVKFDPQGDYVRRYVPELAKLPAEGIHAPWEMKPADLARYGVTLGSTYPDPIVGLAEGRDRALAAYKGLRG
jgi:deoxyribodipyrimidine photo-lyase